MSPWCLSPRRNLPQPATWAGTRQKHKRMTCVLQLCVLCSCQKSHGRMFRAFQQFIRGHARRVTIVCSTCLHRMFAAEKGKGKRRKGKERGKRTEKGIRCQCAPAWRRPLLLFKVVSTGKAGSRCLVRVPNPNRTRCPNTPPRQSDLLSPRRPQIKVTGQTSSEHGALTLLPDNPIC